MFHRTIIPNLLSHTAIHFLTSPPITLTESAQIVKLTLQAPIKQTEDKDSKKSGGRPTSASPLGVSQAISGYQDTNLTWSDIDFIRVSDLPLTKSTLPLPPALSGSGSIDRGQSDAEREREKKADYAEKHTTPVDRERSSMC